MQRFAGRAAAHAQPSVVAVGWATGLAVLGAGHPPAPHRMGSGAAEFAGRCLGFRLGGVGGWDRCGIGQGAAPQQGKDCQADGAQEPEGDFPYQTARCEA